MADAPDPPTIFYSWQSDSSEETTKDFIHCAAKDAISQLNESPTIYDRPRIDQDTQDRSGYPDISDSIFEKIRQSVIFLADLTLVGESVKRQQNKVKRFENSNVCIELGYAAHAIGWDRIVPVMNIAEGPPDAHVFHLLRRKYPIQYNLKPTESPQRKEEVRAKLTEELKSAISLCLEKRLDTATRALARLDSYTLGFMLTHASEPYFSSNWSELLTASGVPGFSRQDIFPIICRLLDMGLIWTDHDPQQQQYAYHWTDLGKQTLKLLLPDASTAVDRG